jgi:hypothetical protein
VLRQPPPQASRPLFQQSSKAPGSYIESRPLSAGPDLANPRSAKRDPKTKAAGRKDSVVLEEFDYRESLSLMSVERARQLMEGDR